MRRLTLIGLAVASVAALLLANGLSSTLNAQARQTKVVFIDSQAVIRAHPSGAQVDAIRNQAEAEVKELTDSISVLDAKVAAGQTLTPDESERYATLRSTLSAVQTRYLNEINAAAAPAVEAANAAIAALAKENGYTIVMDRVEAANQRLVVYSDDDLDITQLAIDKLKAN
ncbi:MAG: OmpH family outer membrane protein [Trueperaceae bacterium]|nr:OmpH family outer membrane protein [Trueperaceae bacterium]MCC6310184.1 OmpH family outer membrane protein [Trueperaceae bacterium]MCO5175094.1 OmpH family outer membrane protein [Trueperaceae bacterium]MCW5819302.1 OmpH family outer membrane protein [Trueperaceae bacterium]